MKRDSSTTQLVKALAESRRGGRLRQLPSTEDQLRKIALELFFEKGFDEVTVKEIADRAGVTQRTFFRLLGSKETVVLDVLESMNARVLSFIRECPPALSPLQALREVLCKWTEAYASHGAQIETLIFKSHDLSAASFLRARVWEMKLSEAAASQFPGMGKLTANLWGMLLFDAMGQVLDLSHANGRPMRRSVDAVIAGIEALFVPKAKTRA